ncbi:hypothetical protein [Kitasatospora sp. A2-31]|uniref:hypothetical protein n=1 Tax=Kitasatospora sp. A2-31 TaxID=2916414 RepID=UPI001EEA8E2F|nr:hypothetical protein [Kitasatospora sp. A2-31]MCG6497678.1 hypothetical protein [Kitasatospora sp. A2-31]
MEQAEGAGRPRHVVLSLKKPLWVASGPCRRTATAGYLPGRPELVGCPARCAPRVRVESGAAVDEQRRGWVADKVLRVGVAVLGQLGGQHRRVGAGEGGGQVVDAPVSELAHRPVLFRPDGLHRLNASQ